MAGMVLKTQRHQAVPLPFTIPVSGKEANAWLPWDLVLLRNPSYFNWRSRSSTTTFPCLGGTHGGRMLHKGKSSLMEVVVMGPGRAVLFYGRWSLGECLNLGKLSGAVSWVGKSADLNANPLTLWEGWQVIAQAITECQIEARRPGYPHSHLATPQPFRFYCRDESPQEGRFYSADEYIEELLLAIDHHATCCSKTRTAAYSK